VCGVELDEPAGRHDGSVQGIRYFKSRPQHGIFAPVGSVRLLPGNTRQQQRPDVCINRKSTTPVLNESGPYSLLDSSTVAQSEKDAETEDVGQMQVSIEVTLSAHRPIPVWRRVRTLPPQSLRVVRGDKKGTQSQMRRESMVIGL
jgi:hypothetical protein